MIRGKTGVHATRQFQRQLPQGSALDRLGQVVAADYLNHRMQVLPSGRSTALFQTRANNQSLPWLSYSTALPGKRTSSASEQGGDHPAALRALQKQLLIHSPSWKPDIVT